MHLRLLSLGYGNVGQALVRMLAEKEAELREQYDLTFGYAGIYTRSSGGLVLPDLSPADLGEAGWPYTLEGGSELGPVADILAFIRETPADVVLELTALDPHSGQPATDHIRAALEAGKSVVTANKGPIAYACRELRQLATERGLALRFESTVLDGTPIFDLAEFCLPATRIFGFQGPLNSTSNYVLSRMAVGEPLEQAVRGAQQLGVAEANPAYDLDGWDASVKATVLANVLMGADLQPADVRRDGLGAEAMRAAQARLQPGQTLKQMVEAEEQGGEVAARVYLAPLPSTDVFAHLSGMETGLRLRTDTMGELTLIEGEGGPGQTAFGVVADLVNIARRPNPLPPSLRGKGQ
jgi:homoserine dehydrogenase